MVWIGRRAPDADIARKIARLSAHGPAPVYMQADAADWEALEQAYRKIRSSLGPVNGVVHAAMDLLDRSLAQMDEARFAAGLRAKVDVSVRLAQVFAGERLDFMLFFSSLQSFSKMPGQANYAAGCTFEDALAHQMAQIAPWPVRTVNWGYWGSVGAVATEAHRTRMAREGIGSIEPGEAMDVLERLLGGDCAQVAFVKFNGKRPMPAGIGSETVSFSEEEAPSLLGSLDLG